ncbi:MAG: metallophosphoesterase, partial [Candidatus Eremiobacteraeota bacterium]|nr:metallophosphoesterase [Candidatus Eremiobacteraeota bacterium]
MSNGKTKEIVSSPEIVDIKNRKTIAVGDLHGDYHRLIRILEEENLVIPGTLAWDPDADNIDLVLVGDYVDWRGEPLEGDPGSWVLGSARIISLMMSLYEQIERLNEKIPGFSSRMYPIIGNHDQMMLDALKVFEYMSDEEVIKLTRHNRGFWNFSRFLSGKKLSFEAQEALARFLNWYAQGGEVTMEAFGGLKEWKNAMEGEVGKFFRKKTIMAVILGGWLYAHTLP